MIIKTGIVRHFGELIKRAEENIITKINDGRLQTEPSVTERLLQEIEDVFESYGTVQGIRFRAPTLRDRGPNAPERTFGADFCGVLDIDLPEFKQLKGFLAQAKSESRGISIRNPSSVKKEVYSPANNEFRRLKEQAARMLEITPDSFAIIYSVRGFVVVPASSIQGLRRGDAPLYGKPLDSFFKEFIMCFIGDPELSAYDDQTLERLRERTKSRAAIMFQIREQ
jgi:hypothetical protein